MVQGACHGLVGSNVLWEMGERCVRLRQRAPTCRAAQEAQPRLHGPRCVVSCGGRGLAVRSVVLQLKWVS